MCDCAVLLWYIYTGCCVTTEEREGREIRKREKEEREGRERRKREKEEAIPKGALYVGSIC